MKLTKEREAEIESCFACPVKFHYSQDQNNLKDLLDELKKYHDQMKRTIKIT